MIYTVKKLLSEEGIDIFAPIPLSKCRITKGYLLEKANITDGCAIMLAIPYLSDKYEKRNISAYAVPKDYHSYFSDLSQRLISTLSGLYPNNKFAMFSDHSPIDERHAAAMSGIGVIGKNQMLITKRYSSYVFLGEIITDFDIAPIKVLEDVQYCIGCNKCIEACPINTHGIDCLSAVTQKKGDLSEKEVSALTHFGCAWGCDICQEVCSYTLSAKKNSTIFSNIKFFNEDLTPMLSVSMIERMSDEDFSKRAYSWRKRETITRNLKHLGYE